MGSTDTKFTKPTTDATTTDGFRVGRRVRVNCTSPANGSEGRLRRRITGTWWIVDLDNGETFEGYETWLELLPEPDAPATPEPERPSPEEGFQKLREAAGDRWAGVDAREYVREMRDDDATPEPPPAEEDVRHQSHYTSLAIEPIDAIRAWLTPEEFRGFCKGSVIAYYARERSKGGDRDCLKAEVYADWLAEAIRGAGGKA